MALGIAKRQVLKKKPNASAKDVSHALSHSTKGMAQTPIVRINDLLKKAKQIASNDYIVSKKDEEERTEYAENVFRLLYLQQQSNDIIEIDVKNKLQVINDYRALNHNFDITAAENLLKVPLRLRKNEFATRAINAYNEHLERRKAKREKSNSISEEECYIYAKKYLGQVITNGNFSDKYTMGHKVGKGATSIVNTCFLKENTSHNKLQEIQDGALEPVTSISRNLSSLKLSKADENDHMDTKFVAKIVKIGSNQTLCEVLCFETEIMYALDSWNIVKFYDCFLSNDPGDSVFSMYLVMEYLNGVNISELSNNVVLPDNFIKPIGYEIIKGIEYLHSVQIIHRDIKGGNIIVDFNKKRIVLIDFGFAADLKRNSQHKTLVGTYHWIAPEVINRIFYSYPIDIWSSGIVLIELFQGHPPFVEYKNCRDILNAILSLDVVSTIEDSSDASESYLKIVSSMLIKEPAKRATIGRLKKHEFFEDKMAISDCLTQIHELISDD